MKGRCYVKENSSKNSSKIFFRSSVKTFEIYFLDDWINRSAKQIKIIDWEELIHCLEKNSKLMPQKIIIKQTANNIYE